MCLSLIPALPWLRFAFGDLVSGISRPICAWAEQALMFPGKTLRPRGRETHVFNSEALSVHGGYSCKETEKGHKGVQCGVSVVVEDVNKTSPALDMQHIYHDITW